MSAKSPRKLPTPESSSPPDLLSLPDLSDPLSAAVQELLELRAEKQRYRELQGHLRQAQQKLRDQYESAYQAEREYEAWLRQNIQHHENALKLLREALERLDSE